MGFLKKLRSLLSSSGNDRNYWFYVKCDHCQEVLKGRIDMVSQLSVKYSDQSKKNSFYCRKVIIGSSRCYKPIEVEFTFDASKKIVEKQITGGEFVTEDDYLAVQTPE
jgi:hypothetical protein